MAVQKTEKSLKHKAASSMMWSALQRYSSMIISFISGIILARLLTPYDYGCIGMLSIFMVLSEVFIDGGFASALIQKKRPLQEDYSTIFFWNLFMAVIVYLVLYFMSPTISRFYKVPILSNVLRVQGLVLFIYAFNIVQQNQLIKKLNFKVLSITTIVTSLGALGITVFMAYSGFGVWALVTQNLITAAIPAIVFWFFIKWRPSLVFSWKSFKELFSFGFYVFLTHLFDRFRQQFQGLLIGRFYDASTMGYYSKAQGTEKMTSTSISRVMTEVTFPLYAEIQDNKQAMQNMVKRLTMTLSYVTFPLMLILMLCAKPIFVLLYSDRWLESVPYFQVLCVAGLAHCLQSVNLQTIAAIGKSRTMLIWAIIKGVVGLCFIVGGMIVCGMKGLLAGMALSSWCTYFVNIGLVSKFIGYKWWRQLLDIFPVVMASGITALISYGCGYILHLNLYLDGLLKFFIYVVVYMSWSLIFRPEAYSYCLTFIPQRFKFWDRKSF